MNRINIKSTIVFFSIFIILITGCSSTEKTVKDKPADDSYVFDEIPPEDIYTFKTPVEEINDVYVIQIGAFSSLDRAKQFADMSRVKLQKDIKVSFNERNGLYVVQIHPPFESKTGAETYRNELWRTEDYSDAWLIVIKEDK